MSVHIINGNCLDMLPTLDAGSVRCCVTSPPYWGLRDYGHADQIGLEKTPEEYVAKLVEVFRHVRRVLSDDGTLWLNLGDSYAATTKGSGGQNSKTIGNGAGQSTNAGSFHNDRQWQIPNGLKPKDLCGIPWRVAFALQSDGWYLRSDIIWAKPNPMPESVTDRPTKAHEYLFLLSKSERYFYDAKAIAEPATYAGSTGCMSGAKTGARAAALGAKASGNERPDAGRIPVGDTRNRRTVWTVPSEPYGGAHFAVMPTALVTPCILAGSAPGDTVLDPFGGSGTVGEVSAALGRHAVLVELNGAYVKLAEERTAQLGLVAGGSR